jgi:hypothetical protein
MLYFDIPRLFNTEPSKLFGWFPKFQMFNSMSSTVFPLRPAVCLVGSRPPGTIHKCLQIKLSGLQTPHYCFFTVPACTRRTIRTGYSFPPQPLISVLRPTVVVDLGVSGYTKCMNYARWLALVSFQ